MEGKTTETQGSEEVSTGLQRVAELARKSPRMVMTSLAHHIDMSLLHRSYLRTRRNAAPGIDGQRAEDYEVELYGNLEDLRERLKSGRYRAPAVRRVHIPKGDGKTRPIGRRFSLFRRPARWKNSIYGSLLRDRTSERR